MVLVTAVVGLALLLVLRIVLGVGLRPLRDAGCGAQAAGHAARLHRLVVLRRVILAFVFIVVLWSVLEIFPTTEQLARRCSRQERSSPSSSVWPSACRSGTSAPASSSAQPARPHRRLDHRGRRDRHAEEITLIHTIVRTDQGLTAFVPNSQMITSTVVNRTLDDPRRLVTVRLPVAITAPVEDARRVLLRTIGELSEPELEDASVSVIDIGEKTTWLAVTALRAAGTAVDRAGRAS